jgi:hypothetical protein
MLLVWFYFSSIPALQNLITPPIDSIHPNSRREFGLLENIQNLILLTMIAFSLLALRKEKPRIEKIGFAGLAVFSCLVLLEEIDYGLHWYEWFQGITPENAEEVRNWHNQGDRTSQTKRVVDIGMALLFLVAPLALTKVKRSWIQYLCPDRYSILTLLAMVIVRTTAHTLRDQGLGEGGGIQRNISEFRELLTYWIFLLYLSELALHRVWPGFKATEPES